MHGITPQQDFSLPSQALADYVSISSHGFCYVSASHLRELGRGQKWIPKRQAVMGDRKVGPLSMARALWDYLYTDLRTSVMLRGACPCPLHMQTESIPLVAWSSTSVNSVF